MSFCFCNLRKEEREKTPVFAPLFVPPIEVKILSEHDVTSEAASLERRRLEHRSEESIFFFRKRKIDREQKSVFFFFFFSGLFASYKTKNERRKENRRSELVSRDAAVGPASCCRGRLSSPFLRARGTGRLFSGLPAEESTQRRLPRARLGGKRRERQRPRRRLFRFFFVVDASARRRRRRRNLFLPFVLPSTSTSCDARGADRPAPGSHISHRGDGCGPSGRLRVPAFGRR